MKSESPRFIALDVFRGLAISLMILVNTPGDWGHVYAPLLHSGWHGLTPTDVVFPSFLFIVGASLFFALTAKGAPLNRQTVIKVVKRALIMFLIGLGLNVYNAVLLDLEHVRIMGVLQRISICYWVGAFIVLSYQMRTVYAISILILIVYYLIFLLFGNAAPFAFDNNIVAQLDKMILGETRMWKMQGNAFDPEGILSTAPAIVSLLFGHEAARLLNNSSNAKNAIWQLVTYGALLIAIGLLASYLMPVNKNIWSVSFVFITCGLALLVLCGCFRVADIKMFDFITRPLQIYGTNPLFVYCLSWLAATALMAIPVGETSLYSVAWASLLPFFSPRLASLVFALAHVAVFWLISLVLYRKNIVVKI